MRVGVLALQGGYAAHAARLRELGHDVVEVRGGRDLGGVAGLVLPGGESTAQAKLIAREPGFAERLDAVVRSGVPLLATCAGLVLAARPPLSPSRSREGAGGRGLPSFGWLDVTVRRNAWGRQLESAEATADDGRPLVLIRAPRIERVGEGVRVEATLDAEPVLVRSGRAFGATFHPELIDASLHAEIFGRARSPLALAGGG